MSTSFIKAKDLIEYLEFKVCRPTLASILKNQLTQYVNKSGVLFYDKDEVKTQVIIHLFREMEAEITTYVTENFDEITPFVPDLKNINII
jgi:hypothetical protein